MAFARLEEGSENAMKEYYKKQVSQLNTLITMLIGKLSPGDRQKIMTICTIDVHARDVVAKIIAQKVPPSTLTSCAYHIYIYIYIDSGTSVDSAESLRILSRSAPRVKLQRIYTVH